MAEKRSMNTAEQEEFDGIGEQIKNLDGDIERFDKLLAIQAKSAKPVGPIADENGNRVGGGEGRALEPVQVKNTQKLEKGIEFARYAMCQLKAKGNAEKAFRLAERHFPESERVVRTLKARPRR